MAIQMRVGRVTRDGGRQCTNWVPDQKEVTGLLNAIAIAAGGTQGKLSEAYIQPYVCSDALYAGIVRFEDKHFPGQRNGYVVPGSAMYQRLVDLASGKPARPQPVYEHPIDMLRRNLLNIAAVVAQFEGNFRWSSGDRVQLDQLIRMAVEHIEVAKLAQEGTGVTGSLTLPWWGTVFGWAIIIQPSAKIDFPLDDPR